MTRPISKFPACASGLLRRLDQVPGLPVCSPRRAGCLSGPRPGAPSDRDPRFGPVGCYPDCGRSARNPFRDPSGRILPAAGEDGSLAGRIAQAAGSIRSALDRHNRTKPSGQPWVLKRQPAARYWAPAKPVLMLTGEGIDPTPRHARHKGEHYLECHILPGGRSRSLVAEQFASLWPFIDGLDGDNPGVGFRQWTEQPWHPFLLQWEISGSFPQPAAWGDLNQAPWAYRPEFIHENYSLPENAPDLTLPFVAAGAFFNPGCQYLSRLVNPDFLCHRPGPGTVGSFPELWPGACARGVRQHFQSGPVQIAIGIP